MNPTRVTVAFDETIAKLLDRLCDETKLSQSEVMRRALKGYNQNRQLEDPATAKLVQTYMDLLMKGEHVILDIDHWLIFLRLIDSSPEKEKFWTEHREVARAHAEQLKTITDGGEGLLMRLETCNFFRLTKNGQRDFTLVLLSERSKDFVRIFLEEYFSAMGIRAEIKQNFTKLRVTFKP
jgi:predicted transcriptional regulator